VFFLIATVGGAILGAILGAFLGVALTIAKVDLDSIKVTAAVTGFLIGIPLSYFTFRWVVSEFFVGPMTRIPPVIADGTPALPEPPALPPA
jgi:hypothetical protein